MNNIEFSELRQPIRFIPTHPEDYRRNLKSLLQHHSKELIIERLGIIPERLEELLTINQ